MTAPTPTAEAPALKRKVNPLAPIDDLDAAYRLAQFLAQSQIIPNALRGKPSDVLVIILFGAEVGFSPMQALAGGVYVVNGTPGLSAQARVSLARSKRHGHKVETLEHTTEKCTVRVTRSDDGTVHEATFTIEDAKRAKLADKDVWKNHPKNMLWSRAATNACRIGCPEVAFGFLDLDELDELRDPAPVRPTLAEAAAEREQATQGPVVDADVVEVAPPPSGPSADEVRAAVLAAEAEHLGADPAVEGADGEGLWPDVTQPGTAGKGTEK